MQIFQRSILKKYIDGTDAEKLDKLYEHYSEYFLNQEIQDNILDCKEEQFQEGFLRELFVNLLGYTIKPSPNYNLATEIKNEGNQKKADGAIFVNDKVVGVIELKDHKTPDLSQIEAQAFGYKNKHKEAVYVAVSNYEKLRFYIDNAVDYEEFDLFHLTRNDFARLWICLAYENIKNNLPKQIKSASLTNEEQITNALYKDYSNFKRDLFEDILKNNPTDDTEHKILLFKKTQKLLDRLLFIFFAEDRGLLPPNSIMMVIKQWEDLKELDEYQPFYNRLKKYFGYMNTGFQGKNYEVFAYNGGLFKPDEILDGLSISDDVLRKYCKKIADYDFASDVDVNILGHIFENSLTEIEEITTKLQQGEAPAISKRKKDGVFYTPQYITKYIVENTVGKLCQEKKSELGIKEEEYFADKKRQVATKKTLIGKLDAYREWLLQISICDPACGSGAFLNAALNFLITEHKLIDEMSAKVAGESIVFPNVENSILENNLYGVDINEESVEIAKLSLWLRTAKPHRKLNSLNDNIKCGNSLIDDPTIAGDKAFDWQAEFPKVFEKGGFDVIIGNPPYGILIEDSFKSYYSKCFPLAQYKLNLYILFLERMFQIFSKGMISFILPKSLLINTYFADMRKYILSHSKVDELFTITEKVFEDAEVGSSLIITFEIQEEVSKDNIVRLANCEKTQDFLEQSNIIENHVAQAQLLNTEKAEIVIQSEDSSSIKSKIEKFLPALDYYKFKNGLNPGNIKDKLITRKQNELTRKIIWGKEIRRYGIQWGGDFIVYDEHIADNLTLDDVQSKKGMKKQTKIDFALRDRTLFETEKLVIRKTGDSLICSYDDNNYYFDTLVHGIYQYNSDYSLKYFLTILNSKPATYFYRCLHNIKGKVFAKISLDDLSHFPVPAITDTNKEIVRRMEQLADTMLQLTDSLQQKRQRFHCRMKDNLGIGKVTSALERFDELNFKAFIAELKKQKISLSLAQQDEWEDYFNQYKAECNALTAQINTTDNEIDQKVYGLYGLNDDDVKVIEGK